MMKCRSDLGASQGKVLFLAAKDPSGRDKGEPTPQQPLSKACVLLNGLFVFPSGRLPGRDGLPLP